MLKNILSFLTFSLLLITAVNGQNVNGSIEHDGNTRDYILHLPSGYDPTGSYPFVYNLHGYGSNAFQEQFYTGMDGTADANGFIVCYPNGLQNSWNVGFGGTSSADDTDFLVTLADTLIANYAINPNRLYSCGMSNGGFMSYKLACEASDRFAAIASVTGSMVPGTLAACNPENLTPVMQLHGTDDQTVQYDGTPNVSIPIEDLIEFWREKNSCENMPDTIQIENTDTADGSTAIRIEYTDCPESAEVVFYKIDGGGHTWPDAVLDIGSTNRDFNANDVIWEFFNRYDLDGEIVSHNENIVQVTDILLYPNPVRDAFTLENLPPDTEKITIFDAYGKAVKSVRQIPDTGLTVTVADLPKGIYFVTTQGKNTRGTVRFVKY